MTSGGSEWRRKFTESLALILILSAVGAAAYLTSWISDAFDIGREQHSASYYKLFLECLAICLISATAVVRRLSAAMKEEKLEDEARRGGRVITWVFELTGMTIAGVAAADQWQAKRYGLALVSITFLIALATHVLYRLLKGQPRTGR